MDWIQMLNDLAHRLNLRNDAALAAYLNVSKSFLSQMRSGKSQIPLSIKLRIADALGFAVTAQTIINFLPNNMQMELLEHMQNHANHIAQQNQENDYQA